MLFSYRRATIKTNEIKCMRAFWISFFLYMPWLHFNPQFSSTIPISRERCLSIGCGFHLKKHAGDWVANLIDYCCGFLFRWGGNWSSEIHAGLLHLNILAADDYTSATLTRFLSDSWLASLVWDLSFGIVYLGTFVWDLSLANFRLGSFACELALGILRLGIFVWTVT